MEQPNTVTLHISTVYHNAWGLAVAHKIVEKGMKGFSLLTISWARYPKKEAKKHLEILSINKIEQNSFYIFFIIIIFLAAPCSMRIVP